MNEFLDFRFPEQVKQGHTRKTLIFKCRRVILRDATLAEFDEAKASSKYFKHINTANTSGMCTSLSLTDQNVYSSIITQTKDLIHIYWLNIWLPIKMQVLWKCMT